MALAFKMDDDVRLALAGLKRELEAVLRARGARGGTLGQMLDPVAGNRFPPVECKRLSRINNACVRAAHSRLYVVREPGKLSQAVNEVTQQLLDAEKAKLAPHVEALRRFARTARGARQSSREAEALALELADVGVGEAVEAEAASIASSA